MESLYEDLRRHQASDDGTLASTNTTALGLQQTSMQESFSRQCTIDQNELAVKSTQNALQPFIDEYKEYLETVCNSALPNQENARDFLRFTAYRPSRKGKGQKRRAQNGGRVFSQSEYWDVIGRFGQMNEPSWIKLVDEDMMGKGPVEKCRAAILKYADTVLEPGDFLKLKCDSFMKQLGLIQSKRKARHNKKLCKEKVNNAIHGMEVIPAVFKLEEAMWDACSQKASRGDLCAHLRHRANFLGLIQTAVRNDSFLGIELSDFWFNEWGGAQEPTSFQHLAYGIKSKMDRDSMNTANAQCLRHKHPELCSHGAIAFYLFCWFDITKEMDEVDWNDNQSWFGNKLNIAVGDKLGKVDVKQRMSRNQFYKYMKTTLCSIGMWARHFEHFGRFYLPHIAESQGCPTEPIRNLGGWEKKVYEVHYSANLPMEALRAAAHHRLERGTHYVARSKIVPPESLALQVFPFIETAKRQLDDHPTGHERITAHRFLKTMRYFCQVLLQDAAYMMATRKDHCFFQHYSEFFFSPNFLSWADNFKRQHDILILPENDPTLTSLRTAFPLVGLQLQSLNNSAQTLLQSANSQSQVLQSQNTVLHSTNQTVTELLKFQQHKATCDMAVMQHQAACRAATAQFAMSLPAFDPAASYSWPCPGSAPSNALGSISPSLSRTTTTTTPNSLNTLLNPSGNSTAPALQFPRLDQLPRNHDGMLSVIGDYLGWDNSVFKEYNGIKTLKQNKAWYLRLPESRKKYVRRICSVGQKFLESYGNDKAMILEKCQQVDSMCQQCTSRNQAAISLQQLERHFGLIK